MRALPLGIFSLMRGAELTLSSRTMAMWRPTFFSVSFPNSTPPCVSNERFTSKSLLLWLRLRVGGGQALTGERARAFSTR